MTRLYYKHASQDDDEYCTAVSPVRNYNHSKYIIESTVTLGVAWYSAAAEAVVNTY